MGRRGRSLAARSRRSGSMADCGPWGGHGGPCGSWLQRPAGPQADGQVAAGTLGVGDWRAGLGERWAGRGLDLRGGQP
eukprot:13594530-Alexandrium_andersonii.AAC.1